MKRHIEIMDTTLRDGEQTSGVSFSASEKLTIAQLLLTELKVDRIEIASARVSEGEFQAVKKITSWAAANGFLDKVEVLTFVDGGTSVQWMLDAGAKVMNLLTKGSLNHLKHQLKKTPEQHFNEIGETIALAKSKGLSVNVYLEDWSNGMRNSANYVFQYLDFLTTQPVDRVLLPDTLGILTPYEVSDFIRQLVSRYPTTHFDFHAHNDYDLGTANALEAVRCGVHGLHLTVNGMGERAGNAPLASVIAVLNDYQKDVKTSVCEKSLYRVSKLVETFSGFRIPVNKPVVGENVFTQTAGIHADGDHKNNLYFNDMMLPSGTLREYKSEIIRADIIIISKIPDKITAIELRNLLKDVNPKAYQQVFFSYLKYGELYSISNSTEKIDTLNDLYRFRIICFSGIANSSLMVNYLKEYSAEVRHLNFSDHHEYSIKDLEDIESYYNSFKGGNKIIVTTEKDLMRLKNSALWSIAERMTIYILPVEVSFKDKENEFNEMILKYVRTNRFHHQKYS